MCIIVKYQTIGIEVYDNEMGSNIGYDNIRTGFVVLPDEEYIEICFEPTDYSKIEIIGRIETIGM